MIWQFYLAALLMSMFLLNAWKLSTTKFCHGGKYSEENSGTSSNPLMSYLNECRLGKLQKDCQLLFDLLRGVSSEQFEVLFLKSGMELMVIAAWPELLSDLNCLSRKWLTLNNSDRIVSNHTEHAEFESFFKDCWLQFNDSAESVARIGLQL